VCPAVQNSDGASGYFEIRYIWMKKCTYTGSSLSEDPPFATTDQGVCCTYTSTATCFGLYGHPQAEHTMYKIYKEVIALTTDPLYIVQILLYTSFGKYCRRYLNVIARYLIVNAITSFLILKC
jgi:hypothetical protein